MPKRSAPSLAPTGDAAVRFSKHLWSHLVRDSPVMRNQLNQKWLTHEVDRSRPVAETLQYEHIIPVMVFALRREIHGELFSVDDVCGCMVTRQEHQSLVKLRTAPNVLIPALACERHQLLDVCLRRYSASNVKLIALPKRVQAPRRTPQTRA